MLSLIPIKAIITVFSAIIPFSQWLSGYPKVLIFEDCAEDVYDIEQDTILAGIWYGIIWGGGILAVFWIHEILWMNRFYRPIYTLATGG